VSTNKTTIVSLNAGGLPSRRLSPFRPRLAHVCRRLEESNVEVVCLQELWTPWHVRFVSQHLPSFHHAARGGLATFSREPIKAVSYQSFRGLWPDAGGPVFRALKAVNSALQGVLTVDGIANVHLSANRDGDWSPANRHHGFQRAQLESLYRFTADATVLCGDFNLPGLVAPDGWRDPFAGDDRPTFHAAMLPPGRVPHRIDYALVRGAEVASAELIFTEPVAGIGFLSDHAGLAITVE
jgi:hypothetical protein